MKKPREIAGLVMFLCYSFQNEVCKYFLGYLYPAKDAAAQRALCSDHSSFAIFIILGLPSALLISITPVYRFFIKDVSFSIRY